MEDGMELSSDSSSQTVMVKNDDIDDILKKYGSDKFTLPSSSKTNTASSTMKPNLDDFCFKRDFSLPSTSTKTPPSKNFYTLDEFSDEEYNYEPLETRLKTKETITKPLNTNLDEFSDEEYNDEYLEMRLKTKEAITTPLNTNSSWQDKFSTEDFCEDSNDIDAVLNRISQLESEQISERSTQALSKEVESLITGNIIEKPKPKETPSTNGKNSFRWSGSSEEEASNSFDLDKLKNDFKFDIKALETQGLRFNDSSAESNSEDIMIEPKTKRLKKVNSADKEAQKLEKELAKAAKAKEREQKKLEKENQKQLKNALKVVDNCVKPDQCIQYITVNIDESLSNKHYGEAIKAGLNNGGYNYKVSKQLIPNLISWTRKVPTIENMLLQNVFQQESHYLLVMEATEFIQHVVKNTLTRHIQSLLSLQGIHHLSIAILGLQRYYKYLREQKNNEFKAAVTETDANKKKVNVEFKDIPKASKKDIAAKLVELQIFCKNIYIRPVEKYEDLAVFVGECTKSVAQIPYKTAKAQPLQQESEFFTVNNRDCVRVDKDGNGLGRLWNQFLRMFPLASLETAEAVSSVYPTIHSLMEAYEHCQTPEEGQKLLQDLPVRRAAGPLGGQRKLGPEFSKKAYKFFCSEENVLL